MPDMESGFSISSHIEPTNEEIVVVYKPDDTIIQYTYYVYSNDILVEEVSIDSAHATRIVLFDTGVYQIVVEALDQNGESSTLKSGFYMIDKEKPVLSLTHFSLKMSVGDTIDIMDGVRAIDEVDGDLTNLITTNISTLDLHSPGFKQLTYTVSDSAGNVTSRTIPFEVLEGTSYTVFFFQGILFLLVCILCIFLYRYKKSIDLERRISKYTIDPIHDHPISLFDKFHQAYLKVIHPIHNILSKSVFMKRYSRRFEKYIHIVNDSYHDGMDFVASKVVVACLFLLVALFARTIQLELLSIYEVYFPLLLGFFAPDLLYITKYKSYRRKLENDLLQAIIVMNNAFKSGRSISQAMELVTTELEGPICEEFKKMKLEMTFGLELDVVFERFSSRIQLEEVTYLTASLSVLNKTGGNIIKVFSSIEQSLFSKKKLQLELASLTGSSRIIIWVLFFVPLLFIVFISIMDPTYFLPFFTQPLGMVLFVIMIIYYIIYVIMVRKIMKVRM